MLLKQACYCTKYKPEDGQGLSEEDAVKDVDFLALHWVGGERGDAKMYTGQPSSPRNHNRRTLRSRKDTRDVGES